jgi:hypothetical protein
MKRGKWIFVTFAEGDAALKSAGERIGQQAEESGLFDLILIFDDKRLREFSDVYRSMDFEDLKSEKGFGFWVWKPILIQEILNRYFSTGTEYEGLLYADAGCEILVNTFATIQFRNFCQRLKVQGMGFGLSEHPEHKYTKKKIELELNVPLDSMNSIQREAGWICVVPNSRVIQFFRDWAYYSTQCGRAYLDEQSYGYSESPSFIASRHDQSLFSVLSKKYGFSATPMKTFRNFGSILNASNLIWTARNKTGVTKIPRISNTTFAGFISCILRLITRQINI